MKTKNRIILIVFAALFIASVFGVLTACESGGEPCPPPDNDRVVLSMQGKRHIFVSVEWNDGLSNRFFEADVNYNAGGTIIGYERSEGLRGAGGDTLTEFLYNGGYIWEREPTVLLRRFWSRQRILDDLNGILNLSGLLEAAEGIEYNGGETRFDYMGNTLRAEAADGLITRIFGTAATANDLRAAQVNITFNYENPAALQSPNVWFEEYTANPAKLVWYIFEIAYDLSNAPAFGQGQLIREASFLWYDTARLLTLSQMTHYFFAEFGEALGYNVWFFTNAGLTVPAADIANLIGDVAVFVRAEPILGPRGQILRAMGRFVQNNTYTVTESGVSVINEFGDDMQPRRQFTGDGRSSRWWDFAAGRTYFLDGNNFEFVNTIQSPFPIEGNLAQIFGSMIAELQVDGIQNIAGASETGLLFTIGGVTYIVFIEGGEIARIRREIGGTVSVFELASIPAFPDFPLVPR